MAIQEKTNASIGDPREDGAHFLFTTQFIPSVGMYFYLKKVVDRLIRAAIVPHMPEQLTINYYEPHEGLRLHTDNTEVIKEWVIGVSLMSSCAITFVSCDKSKQKKYPLFPGSVMIQSGEVRYKWMHGIDAQVIHKVDNLKIKREFRISLQLSDFLPSYFTHPDVTKLKIKDVPM